MLVQIIVKKGDAKKYRSLLEYMDVLYGEYHSPSRRWYTGLEYRWWRLYLRLHGVVVNPLMGVTR